MIVPSKTRLSIIPLYPFGRAQAKSTIDFINQLALANEKLANGQKATVSVGHQNFETAFTDHEQSIIEQFIKHDETVFNKDGRQRLLADKG